MSVYIVKNKTTCIMKCDTVHCNLVNFVDSNDFKWQKKVGTCKLLVGKSTVNTLFSTDIIHHPLILCVKAMEREKEWEI